MSKSQRRVIMRVEVAPGTPQRLDAVTERFLSTHISINSRLVEWLCGQDEEVQAAILHLMPTEYSVDISRLAMEKILRYKGR